MTLIHDHPTVGHPRRDETIQKATEVLPWMGMHQWIADYVKGCATCQQNKIITHQTKIPLYRITTKEGTLPFQQIAMDLKMISDRDPRFMSQFGKALTEKLGIQQNLSTAFHPQTDGLSERKNQWVEQYLRLVTSNDPKGWTHWLALATIVHNNWVNTTTGLSPNQILYGYNPTLNSDKVLQTHNALVES